MSGNKLIFNKIDSDQKDVKDVKPKIKISAVKPASVSGLPNYAKGSTFQYREIMIFRSPTGQQNLSSRQRDLSSGQRDKTSSGTRIIPSFYVPSVRAPINSRLATQVQDIRSFSGLADPVKPKSESCEEIQINVEKQDGNQMRIKIKKNSTFKELFDTYSTNMLKMEDGDSIEINFFQEGGGPSL
uniref:Rad60/SUMO-like domain-containing protein n=1 Tax=Strigamia maritima TaxID=126957 RepID=T1JGB2_STRMM